MSATVARAIVNAAQMLTWPLKPWRRRAAQALAAELLELDLPVVTAHGALQFHCPTRESLHYVREFMLREPETLAWIDGFGSGEVFWDIGANIGQYSLYAALSGVSTMAFEPGAASYGALTRNIEVNKMDDRIAAYCLAFGAATELSTLNMARTDAGSSMHAVGTDIDAFGRTIAVRFRQAVATYSIDNFMAVFQPQFPTHIKLDVDSIEDRIIAGAQRTLADPRLRSVMIELEGGLDTPRARSIVDNLQVAGLGRDSVASRATSANALFRRL